MRILPGMDPGPSGAEGAPEWALTYGDMMSLILVFFIAMASYSTMDVVKYRSLVGSVQTAFGARDRSPDDAKLDSSLSEGIASAGEEHQRTEVEKELRDVLAGEANSPYTVVQTPEGMRIRLEGRVLFDTGKADLRAEAWPVLAKLAPFFARYPYRIWVEGHTDDVPIETPVYPSNWELSGARAGNVVRAFITQGGVPSGRLVAAGYADTRPILDNRDDASRQRNRRVEFLLTKRMAKAPVAIESLEPPPPVVP